jgi:hypothetical protein
MIATIAEGDIHFVTASAFDAPSVARRERLLLWRTTMTIDARGLSLSDALPAMVESGAPHLGRETEVVLLRRRPVLKGRVEMDESIVVGIAPDDALTAPKEDE